MALVLPFFYLVRLFGRLAARLVPRERLVFELIVRDIRATWTATAILPSRLRPSH
jgi:hypothetical protein